MVFAGKIKDEFNVESVISAEMEKSIREYTEIYKGRPYWLDPEEHIRTINFAKAICSETARLATLGISIKIDGSARADWLQKHIDKEFFNIRNWMEYACAFGTVVLKPSENGIDLYTPGSFLIVNQIDGDVTGVVFVEQKYDSSIEKYYTKFEYHRFLDDGIYAVTNRCFIGDGSRDVKTAIDISLTPWSGLMEEEYIQNIDRPLYSILSTPASNNIDIESPLSLSVFADAIEELKDLDIAYSRNAKEIFDSKRILLLDSDRMIPTGNKVTDIARDSDRTRKAMGLPDIVKNVYGDGANTFYEEINPSLETDKRLTGINALLSQIGYKCGFSNGYFVFNESTGIQTATGVEAEQQRTIQFIKDVRDKLENCLDGVIYALNVFADMYRLAPLGTYEVVYDFGDITYNREEDRARWYSYASQNRIPFWYYLMKFEGMTEEEAKAMVEEAQPKETLLFGGSE